MLSRPSRPRGPVRNFIAWAWKSWATRSLAMGGIATVLDIVILLVCVRVFWLPNPVGAMIGVTCGAIFTFFANRHFAFRDHHPDLAPQALRFVLATGAAMLIHGGLVWLLADRWGVPVVLAKLAADVAVFSVGQLLVLRYIVFPRKRQPAPLPARPADEPPVEVDAA